MSRLVSEERLDIYLYTTPHELRRLADRFEREWEKVEWGKSVPMESFGEGVRLHIVIDQSKMPVNKHKVGGGGGEREKYHGGEEGVE